jgi:hypothetical protein
LDEKADFSEDREMTADIDLDKFTKVFLKIKVHREELKRAFTAEDDDLKGQQDTIKGALLDYCKEENVDSVKTASGLFYRTVKTNYWTSDWESMNTFIFEQNLPEFFTKRLNQSAVKQFIEDNPEIVPPGLNADSEYVLTIRKPTKK